MKGFPSPRAARRVQLLPPRQRRPRPVLRYDDKATPFPVLVERRMDGLPIPGLVLAASFREGA